MPDPPVPGRSLVTRRAVTDIIRPAATASYGVTGLARRGLGARLVRRLGIAEPAVRVRFRGEFAIDLHITIAYGLPVAEVARQAGSAVRYALRRTLDREPDRLTIHVGGLRYQPAAVPVPAPVSGPVPSATELVSSTREPAAQTGGGGAAAAIGAGDGPAPG